MKLHIPKQAIFISTAVLVLLAMAVVAMATHNHHPGTKPASTPRTSPSRASTQHAAASGSSAQQAASTSTTDATLTGPACQLLTQAIAQQVLGPDTTTSPPADTSALRTSDTSVSACAYTSKTGSMQLVVRTPDGSLGVSKNATLFGSAKPQNTTAVQGYGQSAYWDNDKHQLDILGNNNWYVITRSTGTQADAEAVAKLLAGKL